jgi:hypothetical protein
VFSNKSLGIAITAIAVMAGLMIGVAGPGRAQDTKAPDKDKAPAKQFKDNAEFELADSASKQADPAKRLVTLQQWKEKYPTTEYADERQDMFLVAYGQLNQPRQAFDQAVDILKTRPNHFRALIATVQMATAIKPTPTPADLDIAEKNANQMLDNPDKVFDPANKPADMTNDQWTQTRAAVKPIAEQVLLTIYTMRHDDKRAVDDLRKLIVRDPNYAAASYTLGRTLITILQADKKPADAPAAFYQIARALSIEGPTALPAAQKPAILTFLQGQYKQYHGSMEDFDKLLTLAKASPFPPAGFSIKSYVDIANEQEAARKAEQDKDPLMYLWVHTIKEALAMQGDSFFDASLKDAGLPPPDDKTTPPTPQYFTGTIISISPDPKPKEIVVGIEKPDVADAKLTFDTALPGKMEPGEKIQFTGAAKEWNHDPKNVVITFDVDQKEGLKGWTGKNATTPGRGAGKGGAAAGKGTGKAAPPH